LRSAAGTALKDLVLDVGAQGKLENAGDAGGAFTTGAVAVALGAVGEGLIGGAWKRPWAISETTRTWTSMWRVGRER
jgi:hypothetical protein